MTIRAVSFDGDDTLWDFGLVMTHALSLTLSALRVRLPGPKTDNLTVNSLKSIRDDVAADLQNRTVNLEEIRFQAFVKTVQIAGGDPEGSLPAELNALYMHHRFEDLELYSDVLPCLDLLGDHFSLGLLSNGNGYPDKCGLPNRFSFTAFAQDLGVCKPDPEFFHRALEPVGISSAEVMHVGDSLSSDVAGANAAGCISVWLNRKGAANSTDICPTYEITSLHELGGFLL